MTAHFRLAGLLRLRRLEQDRAAGDLAAANNRVADVADRQRGLRSALDDTACEAIDPATLAAIAASRAASHSMLADLARLDAHRREEAALAQEVFSAARAASIGLEKLEDKHAVRQSLEEIRSEQLVLDELTSGTLRRAVDGASR